MKITELKSLEKGEKTYIVKFTDDETIEIVSIRKNSIALIIHPKP